MARSPLVFGMAAVFAGSTVVLATAGLAYREPLVLLVAAPFAVSTYFFWMQATGRLAARISRARRVSGGTARGSVAGGRRRRRSRGRGTGTADRRPPVDPSVAEARQVLGVDSDADGETIRRAYRDRVKDVHPDAPDGSEAAFKRVQAAYEQLSD